jgi:SAM-dependent methyltransferase
MPQYYPTPVAVIDQILRNLSFSDGQMILEPSCGDGRIMDALRKQRVSLRVTGVEVDPGRAAEARAKGHHVMQANFLQCQPAADWDYVLMNPPFYGRHWKLHLDHALKFLKPGGHLVCILPASAHYDHGDLPGEWHDLPVASFAESGTNVPTGYLTCYKRPW